MAYLFAALLALASPEFQPDTPDAGDGAYLPKQEQPAKIKDDMTLNDLIPSWPGLVR